MSSFDVVDLITEIKSRLNYNKETGSCIWIKPNKYHPDIVVGTEAGSNRKCGNSYRKYIKIKCRSVPRARIAFVLMNGKWPFIVDHINGDTLDDRWSNLREVTYSQNAWNTAEKINGSGFPKGIRKMNDKFQVRIAANKKTYYVGTFKSLEEAILNLTTAKSKLHGSYVRKSK